MTISEEAVEAAAKATFERIFEDFPNAPSYTWAEMVAEDPSRVEIWRDEARTALEAAMPAIRRQLAEEIRALSAGDPAKRADCCLHEPDICDRCYGREQAAQHIERGEAQ